MAPVTIERAAALAKGIGVGFGVAALWRRWLTTLARIHPGRLALFSHGMTSRGESGYTVGIMRAAMLNACAALALIAIALLACKQSDDTAPKSEPAASAAPTTAAPAAEGAKPRATGKRGMRDREKCSDGNCNQNCAAGRRCKFTCSGGGCNQNCAGQSDCRASCSGGGCKQNCASGAECKLKCSGGGCTQVCSSADCKKSCTGGGCS